MVFSLLKPSNASIERLLSKQAGCDFTYAPVGATANWGGRSTPPPGFRFDRATTALGTGEEVFRQAVDAIRHWRPFDIGWADAVPAGVPVEPGKLIGVRSWAGLWSVAVCRIAYVIDDEAGGVRRFGFGYGTLPSHPESGEERFLVTWDRDSGRVTYDVLAFVRPRHVLARLAGPFADRLADRFRRDSAEAMRRAVAS